MRAAVNRWANSHLTAAWNSWLAAAQEMVCQERLVRMGLMRIINMKLSFSWQKWLAVFVETNDQQMLMRRALAQMVYTNLSRSLEQWQWVNAEARGEEATLMNRAVLAWQNQQLSYCLRWWYWGIERVTPMEQWIVANWEDRELSWAMHIWRYLTDFYRRAATSGVQAVFKWQLNEVNRGFLTWRQNCPRRELSNTVVDVMIASSQTASVANAFKHWRLRVLTRVHVELAERRGTQAADAFGHMKVVSAWHKLRDQGHIYSLMIRSTIQWCGWQLCTAIHLWRSVTRAGVRSRALMSGALLTWVKQSLEAYLGHWRQLTHQVTLCSGVLSKWTETSASIPRSPDNIPDLSLLSPEIKEMIKSGLIQASNQQNEIDQSDRWPSDWSNNSLLDANLRIEDTEITNLDDGNEFVFYHISVAKDQSKYRVKRMYSDIEVLNKELSQQYPQMFAYDDSPQLPSKRYYGTSNPQFVASRKAALEKYLQDVLAIPLLAQAQPTQAFFNIYS
jgi:hypothetical protein